LNKRSNIPGKPKQRNLRRLAVFTFNIFKENDVHKTDVEKIKDYNQKLKEEL
jgi:hypothetical protein